MADIDELTDMFKKCVVISTDLDYQQYYDMARKFMNKSHADATIFAKRAIKEQEHDDLELLKKLQKERTTAAALAKFKREYELFLINKKKVSSCKMDSDCSQDKRELNALLDKMMGLSL